MPLPRTPQDRARRAVIADAAAGHWPEREPGAGQAESSELRESGLPMTIRVYTVTRDGIIKADSGTREIPPAREPLPAGEKFPPCTCPRHRAGQPTVTR